ncbi:uncharacterized protein LOC118824793 isoform X10 [Colossoma macropomum]|uniref:uncharacterized protein LOC118824793 isoform X10 n=1 Tax=Colossoma macropomum TaxID=42526 RepID=UPI0018643E5D|nr:uncharacterized protein LOC118824793 isoform X10 [Colossoma macropomum]
MRAGVSVLLLVALAGLESVLSASLEAVGGQDLLDETADEISDLQKRDDITLEVAGAEEGESLEDGNFMEATRDEIEEMTQEEETEVAHMTREGDTDDEEAAAEVDAAAESLETMEEESKESEEHVEVEEIKDLDEDSEDASQEEGALEE